MPVSKKRKKKVIKPVGPPTSKVEVAGKKRKLSRQQILIYIFSALIILSLAISFIISSSPTSAPAPQGDTQTTLSTPPLNEEAATEESSAPENSETPTEEAPAGESETTPEVDTGK